MYGEDFNQCEACHEGMKDEIMGSITSESGKLVAKSEIRISDEFLSNVLNESMEKHISKFISEKAQEIAKKEVFSCVVQYGGNLNGFIRDICQDLIEKRFTEQFPETIEKKVSELKQSVHDFKFNFGNLGEKNRLGVTCTLDVYINKYVEKYIDEKFKEVVEKTKKGIEEYAQNYFSRNLFKAMNLMSEMTEVEKIKKLNM